MINNDVMKIIETFCIPEILAIANDYKNIITINTPLDKPYIKDLSIKDYKSRKYVDIYLCDIIKAINNKQIIPKTLSELCFRLKQLNWKISLINSSECLFSAVEHCELHLYKPLNEILAE